MNSNPAATVPATGTPALPEPAAKARRDRQDLVPWIMDDASTHSSLLKDDMNRRPLSKWVYYHQPVRNYLKGLGCLEHDLDDLTHDILIKLQTYIVLNYDPGRPFRPYFKTAIRNFYFTHLRAKNPTMTAAKPEAKGDTDGADVLISGLVEYARQIYETFALESLPKLAQGIRLLHAWIIEGKKQEELAAASNLSSRQIRNLVSEAADALAEWMQRKVNPEDLDELAALANKQGISIELKCSALRDLFSHISKHKRLRALLVMAIIYRKEMPGVA